MRSCLLGILLLGSASVAAGQDSASRETPTVTLALPFGVASENVHLNYFMRGAFGGYGSFVRAQQGQSAYRFVAAVDGKPASEVKIIAYLPGCEIQTLELAVSGTTLLRDLVCKPLGSVHLRGQISPAPIAQGEPAEIEVAYEAFWDHTFFGFTDGPVTSIHIATVVPDQAGQFEVDVPDLHAQNLGEGQFQLTLKAVKSGNPIAGLKPYNSASGLAVLSSYPSLVTFVANSP